MVLREAVGAHGGNGGGQREDSGGRGGDSTQGMLGGCGVAAGGLRVEWKQHDLVVWKGG